MPTASSSKPNRTRKSSSITSRPSAQLHKTEITINVYDLLPPGRLSSILWTIGGSLLHSGVVINGREYAYGGHNKRGVTGVYWTKPRLEPPGGTFRVDILQGFTFRTEREINEIIKEVSDQFLGPSYNLLTHNCNHFTSALCEKLTSKPAPAWLNRAASIGLALPCVVPREWISPPDVDTADGELLEEDEDSDEHAGMLESDRRRRREEDRRRQLENLDEEEEAEPRAAGESLAGGKRITSTDEPPPRLVSVKDAGGRELPVAERAPIPKTSAASKS
ncbi:hypothetical protein M409DRAFT_62784 [Zasmidium cellare ATCC 36951]|uniref:PPPDE domain-containing protein n=1 Tax=Zasmidium cellare ATCC 36951 TaxID=1080233 RepID=A0A6A6D1G6_ZASCE|nr:uncharacterized protein M409DRAFT_62784 [Zasmidium cellare ATCC 36951]KAF2173211.1 hypothetical protein M409DRAFT_62784 [Zasmidium cellare ATCC 36951]